MLNSIRMKKMRPLFLIGLMVIFLLQTALAGEICALCGGKEVAGAPRLPIGGLMKVANAVGKGSGISNDVYTDFNSCMTHYCFRMTTVLETEVGFMIKEMDNSFPAYNVLTSPQCDTENLNGNVKVTILQLMADLPCSRSEFISHIVNYFKNKKDLPSLTKALNVKDTDGETYLDVIENINRSTRYEGAEECRDKLIAFACKYGGTYSKVSNKTCPASNGI